MKKPAFIKQSNGSHWVGDGFPVRNMFSYHDIVETVSPFLLLDYAGPVEFEPTTRRLGVGPHPHRGIETVTLVYAGGVSHRDSAGGGGTIGAGDVQWMTAAAGVLHEEYHSPDYARRGGPFEVVQLWVNLPAADKMAAPGYQAIVDAEIPRLALADDAGSLRVIAGRCGDTAGAAHTFTPMNVWDMRLRAGGSVSIELPAGDTAMLFVLRGALRLGPHTVRAAELAVLDPDDPHLAFETIEDSVVLLLGGTPLNEPVVGHGPFVMNTVEEIEQAMRDYRAGRFGHIAA